MRKLTVFLTFMLLSLAVFALTSCSGGGDTDGGSAGDEDFDGTQFVPTDDNAGSIEVEVNEDELPVSQITGFRVSVRDRNGAAVPGLRITCDSELGVGIIEPTTGSEITDSFGNISGRIGCSSPGSFQFGCRLPTGANFRELVTIRCSGSSPEGFDGFPGAAGGHLGGGVEEGDGSGPGGTDTDGVRITRIIGVDLGEEEDQIDVVFNPDCDEDVDTVTPEPFSDSSLRVSVVNNTNSSIHFTRLSYSVPNFDGTGRTFQSSPLALIGEAEAPANGGEISFDVLSFSVNGPGGGSKYFVNASTGNGAISGTLGFRNISVTLTGTTSLGQEVRVTGAINLSFAGYDNCGG